MPFTECQKQAYIDHSLHYGFRARVVMVKWHSIAIQTHERVPWE